MFKHVFFYALTLLPQQIIATDTTPKNNINQQASVIDNRTPQIIKVRESTLTQGNFFVTLYKLVKQTGTTFFEIPDASYLVIETLDRLARGNVTVLSHFDMGVKIAHIQEVNITKDHKPVIEAFQAYIRRHFSCTKIVWNIDATDSTLLEVCKKLGLEIAARTIEQAQNFNAQVVPGQKAA